MRVGLGDTLIGRVRLSGPRGFGRVVPLATFPAPATGVVRIVTRSAKPVRIDGLGVLSA